MDANTIMTLIQGVGFPIFACVALGWYVKYTTDKYREDTQHLTEQHKQEMDSITESLNNNTIVLQKLVDLLSNMRLKDGTDE